VLNGAVGVGRYAPKAAPMLFYLQPLGNSVGPEFCP
jgi:hypothetical protein